MVRDKKKGKSIVSLVEQKHFSLFPSFPISFLLLLILSLLFSSQIVFSEVAQPILFSGDSYFYDGYNIYLSLSSGGEKVMLRVDNSSNFVNLGITNAEYVKYRQEGNTNIDYGDGLPVKYEDISLNLKKVCFSIDTDSASSHYCNDCCARVNDFTKKIDPAFKLELSPNIPDIEVERTYDKTEVTYGEEILVTVEITNSGTSDAKDFVYEEIYPDTVEIFTNKNIDVTGQTIRKSFPVIYADSTQVFSYRIYLKDTLEYSLKGKYTYGFKNFSYEKWTDASSIKLKDPITAKLTFAKSEVKSDEETTLTIELINNVDGNVYYDFDIRDFPFRDSSLRSIGNLELINNSYHLIGSVNDGDTEKIEIPIKERIEDSYIVNGYLSSRYLIQNPTQKISSTLVVGNVLQLSELGISLIPQYSSMLETESSFIELHISKPEELDNYKIENLQFKITASNISGSNFFGNQTFSLSLLNETYVNQNFYFKIPKANTTPLTFKLNGSYTITLMNGSQITKTKSLTKDIKVYALSDAIVLIHSLYPNTVNQNETARVLVNIKNNLDSRGFYRAYAYDDVPAEFIYKDIITKTFFNLEPLEEKQIYSYEIRAPFFLNETSSSIKSTLNFETFNTSMTESLLTKINIKKPTLTATISASKNTEVGMIEQVKFKIENTGSIDAKNINLEFPVPRELELFNSERYYHIDLLNPGENVELFREYRVKYDGEIYFPSAKITFTDEYGNGFQENSTHPQITIATDSLNCYISAEKSVDGNNISFINSVYKVPLTITFYNDCEKPATLEFKDINYSIAGYSSKKLRYTDIYFSNISIIKPSYFKYSYSSTSVNDANFGSTYIAATNNISGALLFLQNATPVANNLSQITEKLEQIENSSNTDNSIINETSYKNPFDMLRINIPYFDYILQYGLIIGVVVLLMIFVTKMRESSLSKSKNETSSKENILGNIAKKAVSKDATPDQRFEAELDDIAKLPEVPKLAEPDLISPRAGESLGEVVRFVNQSLDGNYSVSKIRNSLISNGWDEIIVTSITDHELMKRSKK